jgi:hypothetical protein
MDFFNFRHCVCGAEIYRLDCSNPDISLHLRIADSVYKIQDGDPQHLHEPCCWNLFDKIERSYKGCEAVLVPLQHAKINLKAYLDNKTANFDCGQKFLENLGASIAAIMKLP